LKANGKFSKDGEFLMSNYRGSSGSAHGVEPTVDWRALLVLSSFLGVATCGAAILL
jgi:hypothetical protein